MLEGSVQRDGNRVRVNAQLIDAQSGAHLWADRFEEDVADLFKLQDQVVARLANSSAMNSSRPRRIRGAPRQSRRHRPVHARLGLDELRQNNEGNNGAARACSTPRSRLDPNDADALAGEAFTYMTEYAFGWTIPGVDYDAKILGSADRALALAPDTLGAYDAKSYYLALFESPGRGASASPTPASRSVPILRICMRREPTPSSISADSSRPNPMYSRRRG